MGKKADEQPADGVNRVHIPKGCMGAGKSGVLAELAKWFPTYDASVLPHKYANRIRNSSSINTEEPTMIKNIIPKGTIIRDVVGDENSSEIRFYFAPDTYLKMHHYQECCEHVDIEDICGDLRDLINQPIITFEAREDSHHHEPKSEYHDSYTWTFYEIASPKGSVTIRWYGSSNGYYGESVNLDMERGKARVLEPLSREAVVFYGVLPDGKFYQSPPMHRAFISNGCEPGIFIPVCDEDENVAVYEEVSSAVLLGGVNSIFPNNNNTRFNMLATSDDWSEKEAKNYAMMLKEK